MKKVMCDSALDIGETEVLDCLQDEGHKGPHYDLRPSPCKECGGITEHKGGCSINDCPPKSEYVRYFWNDGDNQIVLVGG